MLETLNSPQMLHSVTVHIPVALSMLGLPLLLLSIAVPAKHWQFRFITALAYVAMMGAAYVATETGERARSEVPPTIRTEASKILEDHEFWAELVWIPAAVTAGFLLIGLIPWKWIQLPYVYRTLLTLALLSSFVSSGFTYMAGHAGGLLVYKHGIGVPLLETDFAPASATEPNEDGETTPATAPEEDTEDRVATRPIDAGEAKKVSFKNDVWPIFEEHCLECHGEDEWEMDSEYDMRTVEAMMIPGEKELPVPPLVPGDPDGSSIVKYIVGEYKPIMPKKKDPLSEDQVHTIRMWIAAGALDDTKEAAAPEPEPEPPAPTDEPTPEPESAEEPMPEPEEAAPPVEEEAPPTAQPEPVEEAEANVPTEPAPESEPMPEADAPDPNDGIESPPNDVDPDLKALKESEAPENTLPSNVEPPQPAPQFADPTSPTIQAPRAEEPQVYRLKPRDFADGRIVI